MKEKIQAIILATQNDIKEYLESDTPLEFLANDIDYKLFVMKLDIEEVIDAA